MLFGLLTKARRPSSTPSRRAAYRPQLEALEDRTLLSSGWAVSNGGSGTFYGLPNLSQPDAAGNLYVSEYFSGTATFGATTLNAATESSSVVKVDPNGNFLWAQQFGGAPRGNLLHPSIALDGSGNVLLAGTFNGTRTFGSTTLTSANANGDAYLCKLDGNGNFLWAVHVGGPLANRECAVAVDGRGNAYLVWDSDSSAGSVAHLAEVDPNGNFLWSEQLLSNATNVAAWFVALDPSGNVYVSGQAYSLQPNDSGFVAKFDSQGGSLWTVPVQDWGQWTVTPAQDPVTGVAVVYVGTGAGGSIRKLDAASGSQIWSGLVSVDVREIVVDGSGNVYGSGASLMAWGTLIRAPGRPTCPARMAGAASS
jgi:hypothetical protein